MKVKDPKVRYYMFFALLNVLVDFIELNLLSGIHYKGPLKFHANNLMTLIRKLIDQMIGIISPKYPYQEERQWLLAITNESDPEKQYQLKQEFKRAQAAHDREGALAVDQYVVSARMMEHLFEVSMLAIDMPDQVKRDTFIREMNNLLMKNNLPVMELIFASPPEYEESINTEANG